MSDTQLVELNLSIDSPAIAALIERVVGEEREACCGDMCWHCEYGEPVVRSIGEITKAPQWDHRSATKYFGSCRAAPIRERAWQQAREGEAEEGEAAQ